MIIFQTTTFLYKNYFSNPYKKVTYINLITCYKRKQLKVLRYALYKHYKWYSGYNCVLTTDIYLEMKKVIASRKRSKPNHERMKELIVTS